MKFIVTHEPLNVTNVELPWETKEKIKKVLYWSTVAAGSVATLLVFDANRKKTETPTE